MGKIKLLLVDDEHIVADTLAIIFTQMGYQCAVAYDGISAIGKAVRIRPQCILMDISLPRLWGTEAAAIILDELPHCRVILYSGASDTDCYYDPLRQRGYQFDTLAAPLSPKILLQKLQDYALVGED